jgi:hypothetical protein
MDAMGIAKLATSIADTGLRQEVGIAMVKKTQDIQADTAAQLIDAMKQSAPNLPAHLGNHINTTA